MYYTILNDHETSRYNRRVVSFRKTPKLYPKCSTYIILLLYTYIYCIYCVNIYIYISAFSARVLYLNNNIHK